MKKSRRQEDIETLSSIREAQYKAHLQRTLHRNPGLVHEDPESVLENLRIAEAIRRHEERRARLLEEDRRARLHEDRELEEEYSRLADAARRHAESDRRARSSYLRDRALSSAVESLVFHNNSVIFYAPARAEPAETVNEVETAPQSAQDPSIRRGSRKIRL